MTVKVSQLRDVCEKLFAHLEENEKDTIEISHDYYWCIGEEQRYNPINDPDPADFTLGQLSDDWTEMEKIIAGNREPIAYAFVWLAAVLQAVGEEVVA
jgi:hypothetical protein